MVEKVRRYDIDWLRTMALGLLVIFHSILSFQTWATQIGFPQNNTTLDSIKPFIELISIWRIPILFIISGMGVCFAIQCRTWKQLLIDRAVRILIPYLFSMLVLWPLVTLISSRLGWAAEYSINFGHLWFLLNIFLYVLWLIGLLIYLKDNPNNALFMFLEKVLKYRFGIFLFALPIMLESGLVNPQYFSGYVDSLHGWLIGIICFFIGFIFISLKDVFWPAVERNRWFALVLAFSFYLVQILNFESAGAMNWLTGLESTCWMLAIFGFSSLHLNRQSKGLAYLNKAILPVYIVHLPIQFLVAYFLLPIDLSAYVKLVILISCTFGISFLLYEFVLKRVKLIRVLFGIA